MPYISLNIYYLFCCCCLELFHPGIILFVSLPLPLESFGVCVYVFKYTSFYMHVYTCALRDRSAYKCI